MTATVLERVAQALADLPTEPDDIAAVFAEIGIRGLAGNACHCPVANYLRELDGVNHLVVGHGANLGAGRVPLPDHVREFVLRFDEGAYPGLVGR